MTHYDMAPAFSKTFMQAFWREGLLFLFFLTYFLFFAFSSKNTNEYKTLFAGGKKVYFETFQNCCCEEILSMGWFFLKEVML